MSEKKLQANLTISADADYDCSYSDTYTEIFVNDFEVTNSDAFIQLASGTRTKGLGKIASAKALIVKNTGNKTSKSFKYISISYRWSCVTFSKCLYVL